MCKSGIVNAGDGSTDHVDGLEIYHECANHDSSVRSFMLCITISLHVLFIVSITDDDNVCLRTASVTRYVGQNDVFTVSSRFVYNRGADPIETFNPQILKC